jgi:TonB family protein
MIRETFTALCLLGAAAPALAAPGGETTTLNARNWDVMLSQYPARAREAREQGPVGFRVTLDREGYATECVVTSSSGYPLLDNETCRLIMTRGEFRGITDEQGRRAGGVFEGVLNWKLPGPAGAATTISAPPAPVAMPAPHAPVAMAQAGAPDKLICRRKLRTGSLADFERMCLTAGEWQRSGERVRREWQEMRDKGHTNCRMAGAC